MSADRIYRQMLWSRVKNAYKENHFPTATIPPAVLLALYAQRIRWCSKTAPLQRMSSVQDGATALIGTVPFLIYVLSLQVPEIWNCSTFM